MRTGMPRLPLALALLCVLGWTSGCIDVPEVVDPPEEPSADSGTEDAGIPDAGSRPDAGGGTPDAGPADTTRPALLNTSPMAGATEVATSTQLVLTFSEPMDADSVQVDLQPALALGTPAWSHQGSVLSLQPTEALRENATYTVTVDGEDVAGNPLTGSRSFAFTTEGPAPDTTAPAVLATSPSQASIGNARNPVLEVVFSEPMNKTSVQAAFVITAPAGFNSGSFTWNEAGTVMTYALPSNLPYGADVAWQVSTNARDAAGNALVATVTRGFRVIRQGNITVSFDPMTSGSVSAPDYYRGTHEYIGVNVGDNGVNFESRLFLGFRLTALPEDLTQINQASLKWWVTRRYGDPFGKFGQLLLEPVNIGSQLEFGGYGENNAQTTADYNAPPLASGVSLLEAAIGAPGTFDITSLVTKDWGDRTARDKRTQYRLRFSVGTDNNAESDSLGSSPADHPTLAELQITFEYP